MSKKQNSIFFMEIFNEILKINDNEIAILFDKKGNYYDVYSDIVTISNNKISIEYNKEKNIIKKYGALEIVEKILKK